MKKHIKKNLKSLLVLAVILLLGFYVRISGASFGLPDLLHPDEARIILDTMSMGQRMSILPEDINYPLFHKYILLLSYGIYYLVGLLFGLIKDKADFAVNFFANPSSIVYLSRIVTSLIGTLTILAAYLWGKFIGKSKTVGLLAGLFVAVEWQLVLESQFALHQNLSGLSSLLAFYGLCLIGLYPTRKSYVIGGLTFGFAVASHQTAVLLFPGILFIFASDMLRSKSNRIFSIKNWLSYWVIALGVGSLGNLHWVFQFSRSLNFFLHGSEAGRAGFSSTPYFSYDIPSIIYWYYSELIRRDYFLGFAAMISVVAAILRRNRVDILYLIISLTYFIFFYNWTLRWMHLFVGLLPISMVYGANWFFEIIKKAKVKKSILLLLISTIIIPNVIDLLNVIQLKKLPETRQLAQKWIVDNIPSGSVIAVDWPALSVSIPSIFPSMLRNRIAQDYFNNRVQEDIRNTFLKTREGKKIYSIIDMIDTKTNPVWPDTMPKEAVERASKSISLRDQYSYFNFIPVSKLKESGVKYLVITSYTYGMALVNDDPRKIFLINNYLKDNVVPFYSNSNKIYPDTQHELIFYAVERMRNYFLQILDNKIEGVILIKEFYPEKNIGPVVKIYQII